VLSSITLCTETDPFYIHAEEYDLFHVELIGSVCVFTAFQELFTFYYKQVLVKLRLGCVSFFGGEVRMKWSSAFHGVDWQHFMPAVSCGGMLWWYVTSELRIFTEPHVSFE